MISSLLIGVLLLPGKSAFALDKINVTLPSKSFQFIIFPLAKERGYMKEEGIDLNIVVMASTPGLQAVLAGEMDFTGSGSSALVAVTQGNAPLKTVLAVNDQVLQWLMVRPQYRSLSKILRIKRSPSPASPRWRRFMLKKVAPKYGLDANKDLTFLALPPGQRLAALQTGVVDARAIEFRGTLCRPRSRHERDLVSGQRSEKFLGHHRDQRPIHQRKPKLMQGFTRALLKALRLVKQNREVAMDAMMKFSELDRELAARTYDGMIGTFTTNGVVDEETQKNDLDIVREVLKVTKEVPIERAYDFSFAKKADSELTPSGLETLETTSARHRLSAFTVYF